MMKCAEFERCVDFLARMIEKYGDEVNLPKTADENTCEILDYKPNCEKKHTDAPERGHLCA